MTVVVSGGQEQSLISGNKALTDQQVGQIPLEQVLQQLLIRHQVQYQEQLLQSTDQCS
jgi:DNA anti-recombination protein RmuC